MLTLKLIVAFALLQNFSPSNGLKLTKDEIETYWKFYKAKYGRNYRSRGNDYFRKYVFAGNLEMIMDHNAKADLGMTSYRLAVNRFADKTPKEVLKRSTGLSSPNLKMDELQFYSPNPKKVKTLKATKDWREEIPINPPGDQGECGACWAFSAAAAIEAQFALKTGKSINSSVQQLLDCSWSTGNMGCLGGTMVSAFLYLFGGGLASAEDYPYTGKDSACRDDEMDTMNGQVGAIGFIESGNETAIKLALNEIGPITLAINAGSPFFQFYWSGVYDEANCTTELNHAVTAVGYGTDDYGEDYWIIKNSWGPEWGEQGYARMKRGKNLCGIGLMPNYPILL